MGGEAPRKSSAGGQETQSEQVFGGRISPARCAAYEKAIRNDGSAVYEDSWGLIITGPTLLEVEEALQQTLPFDEGNFLDGVLQAHSEHGEVVGVRVDTVILERQMHEELGLTVDETNTKARLAADRAVEWFTQRCYSQKAEQERLEQKQREDKERILAVPDDLDAVLEIKESPSGIGRVNIWLKDPLDEFRRQWLVIRYRRTVREGYGYKTFGTDEDASFFAFDFDTREDNVENLRKVIEKLQADVRRMLCDDVERVIGMGDGSRYIHELSDSDDEPRVPGYNPLCVVDGLSAKEIVDTLQGLIFREYIKTIGRKDGSYEVWVNEDSMDYGRGQDNVYDTALAKLKIALLRFKDRYEGVGYTETILPTLANKALTEIMKLEELGGTIPAGEWWLLSADDAREIKESSHDVDLMKFRLIHRLAVRINEIEAGAPVTKSLLKKRESKSASKEWEVYHHTATAIKPRVLAWLEKHTKGEVRGALELSTPVPEVGALALADGLEGGELSDAGSGDPNPRGSLPTDKAT